MKINFLGYEIPVDLDDFCQLYNSGTINKIDSYNRKKSEIEILQDRIDELKQEQNELKMNLLNELYELEEVKS